MDTSKVSVWALCSLLPPPNHIHAEFQEEHGEYPSPLPSATSCHRGPNQNQLCLADHKTFMISVPVIFVSIPFPQGYRNRFRGATLRNRLPDYVSCHSLFSLRCPTAPSNLPSSYANQDMRNRSHGLPALLPYRHIQMHLSARLVRRDTLSVLQGQLIALYRRLHGWPPSFLWHVSLINEMKPSLTILYT